MEKTLSGAGNLSATADCSININAGVSATGASNSLSFTVTGDTLTVNSIGSVAAVGDITLRTTGAASDVVLQHGVINGVNSSGGTTTVDSGRDVQFGSTNGWGDVAGQTVVILAARDVVIDATTFVQSNGPGGLSVTDGGDIKIAQTFGSG